MSPFPLNLCLVKNEMQKGQNLNILSLEKHLDGLKVITLILYVLLLQNVPILNHQIDFDRKWVA